MTNGHKEKTMASYEAEKNTGLESQGLLSA